MTGHIALLGDSIFDNARYVGGEADVITHLRALLTPGWKASLLAVDGSTIADLESQLSKVSADVTHVVISLGGNDVILSSDLLGLPVSSTAPALAIFGARVGQFEAAYRAAIDAALKLARNTTICTIYNGNLAQAEAMLARVGLTIFNDAILRVAFERRLPVIDLRLICAEPADYANPIEPSGRGGQKIAAAIARALGLKEGESRNSCVYAG